MSMDCTLRCQMFILSHMVIIFFTGSVYMSSCTDPAVYVLILFDEITGSQDFEYQTSVQQEDDILDVAWGLASVP